jgi:hypothetical protein
MAMTRWRAFCHPIDQERAELLRSRWASLPRELRTPNQLCGRHLTHCGFITGASYCSFRCNSLLFGQQRQSRANPVARSS